MDISQIINELGEDREHYFNAVAPPIMQTSNFTFKKVADLMKAFEDACLSSQRQCRGPRHGRLSTLGTRQLVWPAQPAPMRWPP